MRKRIYGGMLMVTLINLVLASVFLSLLFYRVIKGQVKSEMHNHAYMLSAARQNLTEPEFDSLMEAESGGIRVTYIAGDGRVLYDNTEPAAGMDNHANRPEIEQAAESGFGESTRKSGTTGKSAYYYVLRLHDGSYLRLSKDIDSIAGMVTRTVPVMVLLVLAVLLINLPLSSVLTGAVVSPLNRIDLDDPNLKTYDELAVFVRTILHQRAQIEDQVRDLKKRSDTVQSIIDHMREGFLMLDGAGVIVAANQSALAIFGAAGDCVGRDAVHLTREVTFLEKLKQARSGCGGDLLLERERSYRAFFNPTSEGMIVLFVDVTDSLRAEEMRRAFTANVSHELKTPLTSISGFAEMMGAGLADPADTGYLAGKIRDEAAHMIALVEDILFLSKLDETEHRRMLEPFDLATLAAEAAAAKHGAAEAAEVTLTLSGEAVEVNANRRLLYELLLNLIDNGIKYNKPGGCVRVDVARDHARDNGGVHIAVSDTGIGIPEEHLPRIFERFYRVDPSRNKKTGGTGLGLSIVKHIALYHDGTVQVESKLGEGTTVTVFL